MDCTEFLDRYSDFRDGLVTSARERRRFTRHVAVCASCRDYDARLRQGVTALRAAEEIRPSRDFRWRLEERLRRERASSGAPGLSARAGIAAALFVAAALGLLALEGIIQRPTLARAPALPAVPYPQPVVLPSVPFVSFQDPRAAIVPVASTPYSEAPFLEPATAGR